MDGEVRKMGRIISGAHRGNSIEFDVTLLDVVAVGC